MKAREIAFACLPRGWNPVPVAYREKRPIGDEWPKRRVTPDSVGVLFGASPLNVGVQLGSSSGGLTDVDLDCPEAIAIGSYLLPKTSLIFGRKSKRQSHRFYKTTLCEAIARAAVQFKDPKPAATALRDGGGEHKHMLLEVRIGGGDKGAQTLIPGSVHESGEAYEFEPGCDGEPAAVNGAELMTNAKQVGAGSLFARYWPSSGRRHDARLAVAGLLVLTDISESWAKLIIEAVARAAGDPDIEDARSAVKSTFAKNADGGPVTGLSFASEVFGEAVANRAAEWLGCRPRREKEDPNNAECADCEIGSTFARLHASPASIMTAYAARKRRGWISASARLTPRSIGVDRLARKSRARDARCPCRSPSPGRRLSMAPN